MYDTMPTYKLGKLYIEAKDKSEASAIHTALSSTSGDTIIIRKGTKNFLIPIPEGGSVDVFSKRGGTVSFCGSIQGGFGAKILRSAVDNVNVTTREGRKLGEHIKKIDKAEAKAFDKQIISNWESSIPESAKAIYRDVMLKIEATTDAYKWDIITGLAAKGIKEVPSESWLPVLTWFNEKILATADFGETWKLRVSLVTTLVKMIGNGVRSSTTMRRVIETHDDDYWSKYAEGDAGS
jgi:hypothetical protein